jgi:hypothetical protein
MADDFDIAVDRWIAKARRKSQAILVGVALAAEARVKELTPVVTGNLRARWSVEVRSGLSSSESGVKQVRDAELGDTIRIVNGAAYARRVEYGFVGTDSLGREYNQAGAGMVAQTVKELPQIARRVRRNLDKTS